MTSDKLNDEIDRLRFERIVKTAPAKLSKSDAQWLQDYIRQRRITQEQRVTLERSNPSLYIAFSHLF